MTSSLSRILFAAVVTTSCVSTAVSVNKEPKARLIVIVSFDQLRGDYPIRFKNFIGEGGFSRLQKEGASFQRCRFEHANTITGPGHSAISTGTYAFTNGIVANDYCPNSAECTSCIGGSIGISPEQFEAPTLGMLLQQRDRMSKVVSISHKDRTAVMMGGGEGSVALWLDNAAELTTSEFYKKPTWLGDIQSIHNVSKYLGKTWNSSIPGLLNPAADDQIGEGTFSNGKSIFPYTLPAKRGAEFTTDFLKSPQSVEWIFDVSIDILEQEKLGKGEAVDLLCVGVSSTDYLGHTFGPDSREVQEMYVQCDVQIERLIDKLDKHVGRESYVLVVTADHGASPVPEQLLSLSSASNPALDAGRISKPKLQAFVDSLLCATFKTDTAVKWVRNIYPPNLYLNYSAIPNTLNTDSVTTLVVRALQQYQGVEVVTTKKEMLQGNCPPNTHPEYCQLMRNSFHPARSGDVILYTKRYWIFGKDPSSHGSPHDYDRWVPLMLLGGPVKPQASNSQVSPADVMATIAKWYGLETGIISGKPLPLKK